MEREEDVFGAEVAARRALAVLVDLIRLDGAMFRGAPVGGLDQGHGLEVVAPSDGRFLAGLEGDEKLGHGADEGVGKPALLPGR